MEKHKKGSPGPGKKQAETTIKRRYLGSQDSAWKEIIPPQFAAFVRFYFPRLEAEIDFSKPPVTMDKELRAVSPRGGGKSNTHHTDLLLRVHTTDGGAATLYAYIEIQGKRESDFTQRVFSCAAKIFAKIKEPPFILIILTDSDPAFFPTRYVFDRPGRKWTIEFEVVKLLCYNERRAELEEQDELFAFVTLAQLDVIDAKKRARGRPRREDLYEVKKRLALKLFERGFTPEAIHDALLFLDWLVSLPDEYEEELDEEINQQTGGHSVPYVTSWERRGIKKGKLADKQEVLARLLSKKFGLVTEERELIAATDNPQKLNKALDAIVFAETKEEVLQALG